MIAELPHKVLPLEHVVEEIVNGGPSRQLVVTRPRGGPGHRTLRWTRTSKQAGKALRSQGHHYARVM